MARGARRWRWHVKTSGQSAGATQGCRLQPICAVSHRFPRSAASGATRTTLHARLKFVLACHPTSSFPTQAFDMSRQGTSTAQLKRGPGRKRKYATDADRRRAYALARRDKDEKSGRIFLRPYEPREWRVKSPPRDRDTAQREQEQQIVWTALHPNYVSPLLWRWRTPSDGGRAYLYDARRRMVTVRASQ